MASAIPAAIGLGSSLFSGISGKGAAKKQEKLVRDQMAQMKPLIDAIIRGTQQAVGTGQGLIDKSAPYLSQGAEGFTNLMDFWDPLLRGNTTAIDQFLAPERRAINQGYQATMNTLARFAPRGGGRVASMARADQERQGKLSDLVFNARRTAADEKKQLSSLLANLGMQGTLGGGGLLSGQNTGGLFSLLNNSQNLAQGASAQAANSFGAFGNQLGGLLDGIFNSKGGGYNPKVNPGGLDFSGQFTDFNPFGG